jgi:uncharacterized MAPEG superfamily protein
MLPSPLILLPGLQDLSNLRGISISEDACCWNLYCAWSKTGRSPICPRRRLDWCPQAASESSRPQGSQVQRGNAMHRNDLENISIFLIIALALNSTSDKYSLPAHAIYYTTFSLARLLHSVFFAIRLQPHRTIAHNTGPQ